MRTIASQMQGLPLRKLILSFNIALVVFICLYGVICIIQPNYANLNLFMNFLRRAAPLAILASGQVFVIISGGFDLSMGAVVTLVVVAASIFINGDPGATWSGIALLYAMGIAIGVTNGLVVSYLKVPSIIATLGMKLLVTGLALMWSGGSPRGDLPDNFRNLGRFVWRDAPLIGTLSIAVVIAVVFAGLAWFFLHRTAFGKRLIAMGDNPRTAELAGTPVKRTRVLAFLVSSLAAVTAGIVIGGFAGVSVNAGNGLELQAIAACVIGGAILLGGGGTLVGAVFGALSLYALFTLLNLLGMPQAMRDTVQGLILIAAVAASVLRAKKLG
ncbi:ABC transporter permease [Cohaesibacter celericrescens]|uniref:ABC transporter permease n=1 Tax=Cohaesibacter celericrescens TaxID=2067669 RepID=UPI0035692B5E